MRTVAPALRLAGLAAFPLALILQATTGWHGVAGLVLGLGIASLSTLSFAYLAALIAPMPAGPRVARLTLIYGIAKAPALWLVAVLVCRLGATAMATFFAGMALVYSSLVHVAVRDSKR